MSKYLDTTPNPPISGNATVPVKASGTMLKAIGFKSGMRDSAVQTATYYKGVCGSDIAPAEILPAGGYPLPMEVSMNATTQGAIIFFTQSALGFELPTHDGGTPTGDTMIYAGPITVATNTQTYFSAVVYVPDVGESDVTQFLADNTPGGITLGIPGANVTAPTVPHNDVYTLDNAGNRISIAEVGGVNGTRTYSANGNPGANSLNQYTSAEGSAVQNGNEHEIKTYQGVTYTYINDGRLRQAAGGGTMSTTYNLRYDALGRCVKRTLTDSTGTKTAYYYYDGEKPILEQITTTSGTTTVSNIYGLGIDEIVVRFEPSNVYYFFQDHEGSVTHVRRSSDGQIAEKYRYDAFGTPIVMDGNGKPTDKNLSAINNRFMFTGREWAQGGLGFYEYRARAYHPGLGRFTSEDPKGFDAGSRTRFIWLESFSLRTT